MACVLIIFVILLLNLERSDANANILHGLQRMEAWLTKDDCRCFKLARNSLSVSLTDAKAFENLPRYGEGLCSRFPVRCRNVEHVLR